MGKLAGISRQVANSVRRQSFGIAAVSLLILGTLVRIPHFLIPVWAESVVFHPWRQTHNLMMVREIMRHGIGFDSRLPIFGPPWVLPFEFPLYQNLAAVVGWSLGTGEVLASRLTTLFCFQAAAVVLLLVALRIAGRVAALIALCIWEFGALLWSWSVAPTIEFLAVLLVMLALLTSLKSVQQRRSRTVLLFATGLWSLAFLVKITTAVVWIPFVLACFWFLGKQERPSKSAWLWFVSPITVGAFAGLAHVAYGESIKASSPFTRFLTSKYYREWNFGPIEQRFDPEAWARIALHGNGVVGSLVAFTVLSVAFAVARRKRESMLVAGGLVSMTLAITVFFNLYVIHNYYFIAVAPIALLILGLFGQLCMDALSGKTQVAHAHVVVGSAVAVVIAMSWLLTEPRAALGKFVYQEWRYGQSEEISLGTLPDDGVAVVGCSWSPEVLYFADRRGLMLHDAWKPGNIQHKIPEKWVGSAISYVFLCGGGYDIEKLFDEAVLVTQVSERLYRVD